jgi:hypothetical protein
VGILHDSAISFLLSLLFIFSTSSFSVHSCSKFIFPAQISPWSSIFIYSFIHLVFIELWVYDRSYYKHWGYTEKRLAITSCFYGVYITGI